jgi:dTDP-4-dehydrorhamnose reductase
LTKVWIAGSLGLVGAALVRKAPEGSLATSRRDLDIGDLNQVLEFIQKNPGITHIINAAAFSQVDLAEVHRKEAFLANAIGPENLAVAACKIGAHLTHISTDYVFPGDGKTPLSEIDPVGPLNYYGETKLEGEIRVAKVLPDALVLRTSWVFGQGGKNLIGRLFQMFQEKETIELVDDQWGRPTYVEDLVDVIFSMRQAKGLYQFANAGVTTKYRFGLEMWNSLVGHLPLKTQHLQAVGSQRFASDCKRPLYSAFDTSKIEQYLGKKPRDWQQGLRACLLQKISS